MSIRLGDKILAGISESDLRRAQVEDGSVVVAKAKDADTVDGYHASEFLLLTGGTMSGALNIDKADSIGLTLHNTNNTTSYTRYKGIEEVLGHIGFNAKDNPVFISADATKSYKLFHEGNKPAGVYEGNGDAAERTIAVGGINGILLIYSSSYCGFVGYNGGIFFDYSNGIVKGFGSSEINLRAGVLTIVSADNLVNKLGNIYSYICL